MPPALTHALIEARLPPRREPERPPARIPDEALLRDTMRAALAARPPGRLWVFAYGALLWQRDSAPHDRASAGRLRGFARRYCLQDEHDRGTPEAPSLTLGIEPAPGEACDGVLFRLPKAGEEEEALWKIWRHEMPGGAYLAQWVDVAGPDGEEERRALTFVADASHGHYAGRVPEAEVVDALARGVGPQGTAAAYLLDTAGALRREGMPDPLLERLVAAVAVRLGA